MHGSHHLHHSYLWSSGLLQRLGARIDLHVEVTPVAFSELSSLSVHESSASVRERVLKEREVLATCYANMEGVYSNAQISSKMWPPYGSISTAGQQLLKTAMEKLNLSANSHDHMLKESETTADLASSKEIKTEHIAEAISYRSLDREGWAG